MAVEFKDYYETLGVGKDASQEEIKKAFRKLAREQHPDRNRDDPSAEDRFKELNEAYEVLGDPEKRRKYDELGPEWERGGFQPPPGYEHAEFGGSTGFSDFFEFIFGSRGGHGGFGNEFRGGGFEDFGSFGSGGARRRTRGPDQETDLLVSLEEANNGSERQLSMRSIDPATGQPKTERIRVKVPAGVRDGQRIRVPGKGGEGPGGAGDLFLRIRYERHPDFRVDGANLEYELSIAAPEAALGCKKTVPTLKQRVAVTIPAGSSAGSRLRLKGLGLLKADGSRGDLFVRPEITVRAPQSGAERRAWEELQRVLEKPEG